MTSGPQKDHGTFAPESMTPLSSTSPQITMQTIPDSQARPATLQASSPGTQQSKSMPSTPSQRPHSGADQRRSPSLGRTLHNTSPRSLHSDSSHTPPTSRRYQGACKYETAMARARRRVPYSLGPEKLEANVPNSKRELSKEEEKKLSADIQTFYEQLLPSPESELRRAKFVEKLERILRARWPGHSINVNIFGSTGNNLGSSDSDVDICITTDCKELSRVCSIAELLAKNGMEKVVCVSSAKVPIVKVWDPELQVACDMNVNNPIALENTELVKSYVAIDTRVRPLAMIIKHWAKRRILNDAALGGTLSSYTWICLALNFLQTREPPILPSLQQAQIGHRVLDGVNVAFDKGIESYKDFGAPNKSTLGALLFQFFRYYAYELDFEESVVSVRLGKLLSKSDKGWHRLQDNRLCVEEPFNTGRNLANTADDTSMKGIHLELRRAFGLLADGQLDKCCEQFVYPPDEVKASELFVPPPAVRPVLSQPPILPTRGGKGSGRGGRNTNHVNRNVGGRRSSNPASRTPVYLRNLPFQMTPQELQLQAQHQQHLLHDQLFQQYQYLQLQEQELRMQLHQQNLRQRGLLAPGTYQQTAYGTYASQDENSDGGGQATFSGTVRAPQSAPLYQQRFSNTSPFLPTTIPATGTLTNPSSPHLSAVVPDTRRFPRRTSMTPTTTGGSLRAHSQPARTLATPVTFGQNPTIADLQDQLNGRRSSTSSASHDTASGFSSQGFIQNCYYDLSRRPAEYVGYYVGQSPSLLGYPPSASISPIPSHVGLAIHSGGLSPRLTSNSPSGFHTAATSVVAETSKESSNQEVNKQSNESPNAATKDNISSPKSASGPLIVNGSVNSPIRRRVNNFSRRNTDDQTTFSASTSEDLAFDTPSSSDEQSQDPLENIVGISHSTHSPDSGLAAGKPILNGTRPSDGNPPVPLQRLANGDGHETGGGSAGPKAGNSLSEVQKPLTAWSLGRQLSSVEEVRTPSPGREKQNRLSASLISAAVSQPPTKPKAESPVKDSYEAVTLSALPNGNLTNQSPVPGSGAAVSNTAWQVQQKKKKKNKKTVKSENDVESINPAGGDFLPLDLSQRKGG